MDTTQTIILTSIVNIIITGLVGGLVIYRIQKKIDATIQRSLFEHQTKFSRSYPKTLEVLETLYQKYLNFQEHLSRFVINSRLFLNKPGIEKEFPNELEESLDARYEFSNYIKANRLFLPAESIREIDNILLKTYFLGIMAKEYHSIPKTPTRGITQINKELEEIGLDSVKINREMKKDPLMLLEAIATEIGRQGEKLEKHYKSITLTEH